VTTRLSTEQLRTVMRAAQALPPRMRSLGDQLETVEVTDASVADLVRLGAAAA
jgi:hypothetical protein